MKKPEFWPFRTGPLHMDYRAAKHFIISKLRDELPEQLYYHGLHHTLDVLRIAADLCKKEGVGRYRTNMVKTAALFHDAGFIKNHHSGHEAEGCALARMHLPRFGYTDAEVERICSMIMSTKIPQSPADLLDQILCDADLDYLGRPDFYPIGATLFQEMTAYRLIQDEKAWNRLQVNFLTAHRYHTQTNQASREPIKQRYLAELQRLVATYDPK